MNVYDLRLNFKFGRSTGPSKVSVKLRCYPGSVSSYVLSLSCVKPVLIPYVHLHSALRKHTRVVRFQDSTSVEGRLRSPACNSVQSVDKYRDCSVIFSTRSGIEARNTPPRRVITASRPILPLNNARK